FTVAPPCAPRETLMSPSNSRIRSASRIVGRETANCSISCPSVGRLWPGGNSPVIIRRLMVAATISAILGILTFRDVALFSILLPNSLFLLGISRTLYPNRLSRVRRQYLATAALTSSFSRAPNSPAPANPAFRLRAIDAGLSLSQAGNRTGTGSPRRRAPATAPSFPTASHRPIFRLIDQIKKYNLYT